MHFSKCCHSGKSKSERKLTFAPERLWLASPPSNVSFTSVKKLKASSVWVFRIICTNLSGFLRNSSMAFSHFQSGQIFISRAVFLYKWKENWHKTVCQFVMKNPYHHKNKSNNYAGNEKMHNSSNK